MQQTDALDLAVKFGEILFLEHEPNCPCVPGVATVLHRKKCKVRKKGYCTCKAVIVHAPVCD